MPTPGRFIPFWMNVTGKHGFPPGISAAFFSPRSAFDAMLCGK